MTEHDPHRANETGVPSDEAVPEASGAAGSDEAAVDSPEEVIDMVALAEQDPRSKAELLGALVDAEQQRDEYLDDLRRARAEFENYRRRMMREGATQRDSGRAEVATALLEVLDDLERTEDVARQSSDEALARGVEMVAAKLRGALEAQGLAVVDETDVVFDPELHEAVQHRDTGNERDEPTVVEVMRVGYRWGDRTLRAAMVVVEG